MSRMVVMVDQLSPDDPHQIALIVHHAVAHGNAAGGALVEGHHTGPVGGAAVHDNGRFKGEIPPLLPQVQQIPQPLVLLAVDLGLIQLPLQLGVLLFQIRILLLQRLYVLEPLAHGAEPPTDSGAHRPEGGGNDASGVLEKAGLGAESGGHTQQHRHHRHRRQHHDAVFLEKILHTFDSLLQSNAHYASSVTPNSASIRLSNTTGRPMTLKKSPSMRSTSSAPCPCTP